MAQRDYLRRNMFSMLSGENREAVVECLIALYKLFDDAKYGRMTYKDVSDAISDKLFAIATTQEEIATSRRRATTMLTRFCETGYIDDTEYENQEKQLSLTKDAYSIIETLMEMDREEEPEYLSSISQIRTILNSESVTSAPYEGALIPIEKVTKNLFAELRRLRVDLRNRINEDAEEMTLEERYERLISFSSTGGLFEKFERLHNESISTGFSDFVVEKLRGIKENQAVMKKMIETCAKYEQITEPEAENDLTYRINRLIESYSFSGFEDLINQISERISEYYGIMQIRARFLKPIKNSTTQETLISILKETKDYKEQFDDFGGAIKCFETKILLPFNSKVTINSRAEANTYKPAKLSKEEKDRILKEKYQEQDESGFEKINEKVLALLGDREEITAEDLTLQSHEDVVFLSKAIIQSKEKAREYEMELNGKYIDKDGYHYPDFTITRRKHGNKK